MGSAGRKDGPSWFFTGKVEVREFGGRGGDVAMGVSESLFICLVADFICCICLGFSNIRFENKDHLSGEKGSKAAWSGLKYCKKGLELLGGKSLI